MTVFKLSAAAALLWLSGCTTYSADGGFERVAEDARRARPIDVRWLRTDAERQDAHAQVTGLLQRPLTADDAVAIALLNNRGLQARFEELRLSESQLVRSGRLPDPSFTFAHAQAGGLYNIEEKLSFNVIALLSLPAVHAIEQRRFAQTQQSLVLDISALADATRRAYYTALAARDSRHYAEQVADAASAADELGQRMRAAGNWNDLEAANERGFALAAAQNLTRARLEELQTSDRLAQLLGLDDAASTVTLAEHLPPLPDAPDPELGAVEIGIDTRVDLRLQRQRLDELARRLKLTKATRFVNVLEAGPSRILDGTRNDPYESGYQVTLEIPLFDGGGTRVREAEAVYARAADRFAQAAVTARTQIHTAYARVRASYDIAARQRADVLPLRAQISRQNLLRYNAAQVSVFDLLADARARIDAVDAYLRAVRDYWIDKSALDSALIGNTSADPVRG